MKTRPWPIVILAVLYFLGPLFNTFAGSIVMKISYGRYLISFFRHASLLDQVTMFALYPVAGIAIYMCKSWSYPVYLAVMVTSLYFNVHDFRSFSNVFTLPMFLATVIFNVGLVSYFLLPAVRTTYFNRKVRWWENKPRFQLKLPAIVDTEEGQKECEILDISEGGVFVRLQDRLSMEPKYMLHFTLFNRPISVNSKIVYRREQGLMGYGFQFEHTPETLARFRRLAKGLKHLGIDLRTPSPEWQKDLKDWALKVVTTGKGLVPEIPASALAAPAPKTEKPEEKAT